MKVRDYVIEQGADLREANLRRADLREADLRGADLDFSSWPLWCGSVGVVIDEKIARQLIYHAVVNSQKWFPLTTEQKKWVNRFHRVPEVEAIK